MQISAEVRWFFRGGLPAALEAWFEGGTVAAGGGGRRDDVYLLDPRQRELGIKQRGAKPGTEIKGLVAVLPPIERGPFAGRIELWTKWTTEALAIDGMPTIAVSKARRLRKYDAGGGSLREIPLDASERPLDLEQSLPAIGCNVELTSIDLAGAPRAWSTLSFEAFGPLDAVEAALRRTVDKLARHAPDVRSGALELSYPAWLCQVCAP